MAQTQIQRWYPPPFDVPGDINKSTLDITFKAIFQNIYGLESQAVQGVTATGVGVAWGTTSVTGTALSIPTGLLSVALVLVSLKDFGVAEIPAGRPSNAPGLVDLNVTKAAGGASTTPRNVGWIAIGTPPSQFSA